MSYTFNEEGERIAADLIPKFHEHLNGIKIAYLIKEKKAEVALEIPDENAKPKRGRPRKVKKAGTKTRIASCRLVSDTYRTLLTDDYRFIITIHDPEFWDECDEKKKIGIIDHEICHAVLNEDGEPRLRKHFLEEFPQVIRRNGFFLEDRRVFYEACQGADEHRQNVELRAEGGV